MSLLTTATAIEDNVLDTMKMAEDAVVHTAHTFAEGFKPLRKYLPEPPVSELVPGPAEIVEHAFGFIDRLTANLREFSDRLVTLAPSKGEDRPTAVKASSKAQAA